MCLEPANISPFFQFARNAAGQIPVIQRRSLARKGNRDIHDRRLYGGYG